MLFRSLGGRRQAPLVLLGLGVVLVGFVSGRAVSVRVQSVEIEGMMNRFLAAFSNRDVDAFSSYFAEDASMFFPPSAFSPPRGLVEGRANIANEFRGLYERTGPRRPSAPPMQPQDLRLKAFDGFAVVTFHLGNDSVRARRTFGVRRMGTDWKIVHVHSSSLETQRPR